MAFLLLSSPSRPKTPLHHEVERGTASLRDRCLFQSMSALVVLLIRVAAQVPPQIRLLLLLLLLLQRQPLQPRPTGQEVVADLLRRLDLVVQ